MTHRLRMLILLLGLFLSPSSFIAQTPAPKDTPQKKSTKPEKPASTRSKGERINPLAEQRRNTAISLLTSLAEEAKAYRDQVLRARVLARAADALWTGDTERARALFQRAWDAAVAADAESARRMEEDIRKQSAESGSAAVAS